MDLTTQITFFFVALACAYVLPLMRLKPADSRENTKYELISKLSTGAAGMLALLILQETIMPNEWIGTALSYLSILFISFSAVILVYGIVRLSKGQLTPYWQRIFTNAALLMSIGLVIKTIAYIVL